MRTPWAHLTGEYRKAQPSRQEEGASVFFHDRPALPGWPVKRSDLLRQSVGEDSSQTACAHPAEKGDGAAILGGSVAFLCLESVKNSAGLSEYSALRNRLGDQCCAGRFLSSGKPLQRSGSGLIFNPLFTKKANFGAQRSRKEARH